MPARYTYTFIKDTYLIETAYFTIKTTKMKWRFNTVYSLKAVNSKLRKTASHQKLTQTFSLQQTFPIKTFQSCHYFSN